MALLYRAMSSCAVYLSSLALLDGLWRQLRNFFCKLWSEFLTLYSSPSDLTRCICYFERILALNRLPLWDFDSIHLFIFRSFSCLFQLKFNFVIFGRCMEPRFHAPPRIVKFHLPFLNDCVDMSFRYSIQVIAEHLHLSGPTLCPRTSPRSWPSELGSNEEAEC